MNQGLTNSVHCVPQVCQYILVNANNSKAYAFIYAFFPIAYHSLSTECPWFSLFFLQHTIRIVLFCWMFFTMVRIGVSNPSQKYPPLFLAKPPLKSWNCPKPPLFRKSSPLNWFFVNPLPKSWDFQWTPKILKFFILTTILSFKSN